MRRVISTSFAAFALAAAACSLGLDESRIGAGDGGAPDAASTEEASAPDAGEPPPDAATGLVATCATDADCKSSDACLTGSCDLVRKACVYDVCKPPAGACQAAVCDQGARTCGAPKAYPLKAAQFPVGAGVGCQGSASRCLAAVYPFVVVGTTNGALAFSAADPAATAPTQVPVTGLSFYPIQILASGSRVWFLGSPFGVGGTSRVPIAWLDVPVDPFVKSLHARSVLASWDRPAGEAVGLALGPAGDALLLDLNPGSQYAAARLAPPLTEPLLVAGAPTPMGPGATPVAPTGTRVLTQILNVPPQSQTGTPSFGFVNGAGAQGAQNAGEAPVPAVAPVGPVQTFAANSAGGVLWVTESLTAPPSPGPTFIRALRAHFLVADGAANLDTNAGVDLFTYPAAPPWFNGQPLIGQAAFITPEMAVVTGVPPTTPPPFSSTDVMFVKKAPLGVVKNADASIRKHTIGVAAGALGVSSSHGRAYVLASESSTASTVFVLDPECAP